MIRWIRLECLQVFNKQMVSANDCKMFIAAGKFTQTQKSTPVFYRKITIAEFEQRKTKEDGRRDNQYQL